MSRSMSEILGETIPQPAKSDAPAAEPREAAPAEDRQALAKEEKSAPKDEPKKAPESPQAKEDEAEETEHVPDDFDGLKKALAAARGDKRKARKAYREIENQMAELQGQIKALRSVQPQPKDPPREESKPAAKPIDLDEDAFYTQGPAAVKAYVAAQLEAERAALAQQSQRQMFLQSCEFRAAAKHPDYWQKVEKFKQSAPPYVLQQVMSDSDPAEAAYEWITTSEALSGVGSIEELRAKHYAEFQAEQAAKQAAVEPKAPPPQPQQSIASARGTGAHAKQAWTGPRPLGEIFTGR